MRCFRAYLFFVWTGALCPALAQDYLSDIREPADKVGNLATPFTTTEEPVVREKLGLFSNEPFFHDTIFSIQPRFYYRSVRNAAGVQDTFAGGGSMGLITGWWREAVQFGVAGYTTQPLVATKTNNRSGLVQTNGDGFFTLGEAWTKVRAGPATATLFRQILNLPFINANDSRMIPNTFEAYQLEARPWDFLRVNAGYITRMKARNSPDFVPMSEAAGAPQVNRGTTFGGFVIGSNDGTYVGAITELTWDIFSCSYVQAGHTWNVNSDLQVRGDLQFSDQRSVGSELIGSFATQFYGARLAASYGGALISFSYTNTTHGTGLLNPYGGDPCFNGLMISNFTLGGEQSFGVGVTYNFDHIGLRGLTMFSSYVYGALPGNAWEQEINVTADYRINSGLLKNFWLRLRYAHNEQNSGARIEDFRVILNYALNF